MTFVGRVLSDPALKAGLKRPALLLVLLLFASSAFAGEKYAVIVTGASGGDAYARKYDTWRSTLVSTLREKYGYAQDHVVALSDATRENVRRTLGDLRQRLKADDQLFILLIGHGTSMDGEEAKFNLVGPDLSATEWAELIRPIAARVVFVNTSSASFPFLRRIAGKNRIVLTSTDSAAQTFETIFPEYFVNAFTDAAADTDKNGRISIWEAFSYASSGVLQAFQQKGQLPTERPLLDDTGAGIGREAQNPGPDGAVAKVTYLQPDVAVAMPADSAMAGLIRRRNELEAQVEELRARKDTMPTEQYEAELERIVLEIARLSAQIRTKS